MFVFFVHFCLILFFVCIECSHAVHTKCIEKLKAVCSAEVAAKKRDNFIEKIGAFFFLLQIAQRSLSQGILQNNKLNK
jgi:hypothetical protein